MKNENKTQLPAILSTGSLAKGDRLLAVTSKILSTSKTSNFNFKNLTNWKLEKDSSLAEIHPNGSACLTWNWNNNTSSLRELNGNLIATFPQAGVVYSPDSKFIIGWGVSRNEKSRVWNPDGKLQYELNGSQHRFCPNSDLILVMNGPAKLEISKISGEVLGEMPCGTDSLRFNDTVISPGMSSSIEQPPRVSFSGSHLLNYNYPKSLTEIWEIKPCKDNNGSALCSVVGRPIGFLPNNRSFLTHLEGELLEWDFDGNKLKTYVGEYAEGSLCGRFLWIMPHQKDKIPYWQARYINKQIDRTYHILDTTDGEHFLSIKSKPLFSPDLTYLLGEDEKGLILWDCLERKICFRSNSWLMRSFSNHFIAGGKLFVADTHSQRDKNPTWIRVGGRNILTDEVSDSLGIYDNKGNCLKTIVSPTEGKYCDLKVTNDGATFMLCTTDSHISVWNTSNH